MPGPVDSTECTPATSGRWATAWVVPAATDRHTGGAVDPEEGSEDAGAGDGPPNTTRSPWARAAFRALVSAPLQEVGSSTKTVPSGGKVASLRVVVSRSTWWPRWVSSWAIASVPVAELS